jgi:beta-glucanase (GH16 family)
MVKKRLFFGCILTALIASSLIGGRAAGPPNWVLSWSDEFDGSAGSAPDQSKWGYDVGGNGWGNNELEYYTTRTDNAFLDGNGNLVIKAIKENYTGSDGVTRNYTSARLLTRGKFSQKYGRFEARIKLPFGQGIWPAFWMLGADIDSVGWPTCGEVDIMENVGREPSTNHGSMHGPGYSGGSPLTGTYTLPNGARFSDDFHVFALEWAPGTARFYVDGNLYETRTPADVAGSKWVFDHPFFILLNVAVGGSFPGSPDSTTVLPQTMLVDYVRVYSDSNPAGSRPTITGVAIAGKSLVVGGANFDTGSVLLLNSDPQRTLHDDQNPGAVLIGKKTAKRIPQGQPVILQVQSSDGTLSDEFPFTR